jgi:hypothetical protein
MDENKSKLGMDKGEVVAAYMDRVIVSGTAFGGEGNRRVAGEIMKIDSGDDTVYIDGLWCKWTTLSTDPAHMPAPEKPYESDPRVVVTATLSIEMIRKNCPRVRLTGDGFTDEGKAAEAYLIGLLAKSDATRPGAVCIACIDPDGLAVVMATEGDEDDSFEFID